MRARGILLDNPTLTAYRMSFLTHCYMTPLSRLLETEYGLLFHEWVVLFCLGLQNGLSAKDVSDVTGRPKNTISRAVHKLLNLKLIVRRADASDGRAHLLSLTPAGKKYYDEIVPRLQHKESEIYGVLNNAERQQLIKLLGKVIDHAVQQDRE
jgi:DNA-binding MarR family transcriptional regulator